MGSPQCEAYEYEKVSKGALDRLEIKVESDPTIDHASATSIRTKLELPKLQTRFIEYEAGCSTPPKKKKEKMKKVKKEEAVVPGTNHEIPDDDLSPNVGSKKWRDAFKDYYRANPPGPRDPTESEKEEEMKERKKKDRVAERGAELKVKVTKAYKEADEKMKAVLIEEAKGTVRSQRIRKGEHHSVHAVRLGHA